MTLFIMWLVMAVAIMITAFVLPGVQVGFFSALIAAVALGLVNTFIRPFLVILTLPINVLTLGLFTFIINGLLIWLVSVIVPGFRIGGFWMAVLFGLILSIVQVVIFSIVAR